MITSTANPIDKLDNSLVIDQVENKIRLILPASKFPSLLSVLDVNGMLIKQKLFIDSSEWLDLSEIGSGIYFLSTENTKPVKIVLIH